MFFHSFECIRHLDLDIIKGHILGASLHFRLSHRAAHRIRQQRRQLLRRQSEKTLLAQRVDMAQVDHPAWAIPHGRAQTIPGHSHDVLYSVWRHERFARRPCVCLRIICKLRQLLCGRRPSSSLPRRRSQRAALHNRFDRRASRHIHSRWAPRDSLLLLRAVDLRRREVQECGRLSLSPGSRRPEADTRTAGRHDALPSGRQDFGKGHVGRSGVARWGAWKACACVRVRVRRRVGGTGYRAIDQQQLSKELRARLLVSNANNGSYSYCTRTARNVT